MQLVSMGFPYDKVMVAIDCTTEMEEALVILTYPKEALIKIFSIPDDGVIDFALEAHQGHFQNTLAFLRQNHNISSTSSNSSDYSTMFSNDFDAWDDRRDFFSNVISTTRKILTSCTTHCMFCSTQLPDKPFSAICDMCLATYSFPFVDMTATGTNVKVLNEDNPEDFEHLTIVTKTMAKLRALYSGILYKYTKVEYWRNYALQRQYDECKNSVKNKQEMFLWHGTANQNIEHIMKDNFNLKHLGKNSGNKGYFGAGMYFSAEHIRVAYDNKVLLCKVLVGNVYNWPANKPIEIGCGKKSGYDSHYSGTHASGQDEYVIFEMKRILPCYVVHLAPR